MFEVFDTLNLIWQLLPLAFRGTSPPHPPLPWEKYTSDFVDTAHQSREAKHLF